ncbi:MAG: hypothetical protein KME57_14760 [Scytonema hyalinum WJT4-NPBG1]|nr:hypothetical protein [Scytonema hyalinum WJT4-NPBG1]
MQERQETLSLNLQQSRLALVFVAACKNGKKTEKMAVTTGFNEWYEWAYKQRLVLASTAINGEHRVMLPSQEWIPATKAMQLYPIE